MPPFKKTNLTALDLPEKTLEHSKIIKKKAFLKKIYIEFYTLFKNSIQPIHQDGRYVELGSGGGFIKEIIPSAITSDVQLLPGVDQSFSALDMPYDSNSVDAFFLFNVFHHIPDSKAFLHEVSRCLKPGGKIVMIEPASTPFARFFYRNFHHELFDTEAGWSFECKGPLSSANGALPWIVFQRDQKQFAREFPGLKVAKYAAHTPLKYLLSGGLTLPFSMPGFTYGAFSFLEAILSPLNSCLGMFVTIELIKR